MIKKINNTFSFMEIYIYPCVYMNAKEVQES